MVDTDEDRAVARRRRRRGFGAVLGGVGLVAVVGVVVASLNSGSPANTADPVVTGPVVAGAPPVLSAPAVDLGPTVPFDEAVDPGDAAPVGPGAFFEVEVLLDRSWFPAATLATSDTHDAVFLADWDSVSRSDVVPEPPPGEPWVSNRNMRNELWVVERGTGNVVQVPVPESGLIFAEIAIVDDHLVFFHGRGPHEYGPYDEVGTSPISDAVYAYDLLEGSGGWREIDPFPGPPAGGPTVATVGGTVVVAGGFVPRGDGFPNTSSFRLRLDEGWDEIDLPVGGRPLVLGFTDTDMALVAGGLDLPFGFASDVYRLRSDLSVETLSPFPNSGIDLRAGATQRTHALVAATSSGTDAIALYEDSTGMWTVVEDLPEISTTVAVLPTEERFVVLMTPIADGGGPITAVVEVDLDATTTVTTGEPLDVGPIRTSIATKNRLLAWAGDKLLTLTISS